MSPSPNSNDDEESAVQANCIPVLYSGTRYPLSDTTTSTGTSTRYATLRMRVRVYSGVISCLTVPVPVHTRYEHYKNDAADDCDLSR